MKLNLTRPLVFFDLESTGKEPQKDRIVEMAFSKIHPDGQREEKRYLINPGRPIPPEVTAIHGITDDMVKDAPFFQQLAKALLAWLEGCDLAGFNLLVFDIPMLFFEFCRAGLTWNHRDCHVVDAGNIFKIQETRTLTAAVRFYCDREHEGAHGALADTLATADVLFGQLEKYPGLPTDLHELATFSNYGRKRADVTGKFTINEDGDYVFNFGPHRDELAKKYPAYLEWMLTRDFASDALEICDELIGYSMADRDDDDF